MDEQLNELMTLAGTTGDRPATYTIPAATDLQKIAQGSTILTVMTDLSAGGDKAKMTWLAICNAQFPGVVGKIIEVEAGRRLSWISWSSPAPPKTKWTKPPRPTWT